jgi:hypothetical protein
MNMNLKTMHVVALITLGLFIFSGPVSAAINQVPAGGTVFLGETNVDISAAAGAGEANISWWASGAQIQTSSPDFTYNIQNTGSFSATPSVFGSHLGAYYLTTTKTPVFTIADPQLAIRIEDVSVGNVDVTDRWVPTDDALRFRIDSNLMPVMQRGVASVPITIRVQDPNGATYTSLLDGAGTATSLENMAVTSTPFYTGAIWNTSQRATYSPGMYTIWAECNVNSMKDNYEQTGKTVSQKVSLVNQDQNPRINNPAYVTNPSTSATTARPVTTIPTKTVTMVPSPTAPPTPAPTTVVTTSSSPAPAITAPLVTAEAPVTTTTKAPGFGTALGIISLLIGLFAYYLKK